MLRYGPLFLVLVLSACDLTQVPPPPVPLTAIEAAAGGCDPILSASRGGVRLVQAAPARSLVTLHFPDIGGTIRRFPGTSLHRLFTSREMQEAFGPLQLFLKQVPMGGRGQLSPGGFDPNRLLAAMKGELLISLKDIEIENGQPKSIELLAAVSVTGAVREAEQMVEFVGMMASSGRDVKVEKGAIAGASFTRVVGRTPFPYVAELAVHGDALLLGLGRESVTAAIGRLANNGAGSLADDPTFRRSMKRCGDPRDAFRIHIDIGQALDRFAHLIPPEASRVLRVLGLDRIRAFSTAIRIDGKDIAVSSLLDSPGGKDILTRLLGARPVDRQFLDRIPEEAASFSIFALDGAMILAQLRQVLPAGPRADLLAGLDRMRAAGIDLEADVFEVFGPRCALVSVPLEEGGSTGLELMLDFFRGTAFVMEVQDPGRALRILEHLPRAGKEVRRREHMLEGTPTVTYRFDAGPLPGEFTVSHALKDGYLIVGFSEHALRAMLKPLGEKTARRYRELTKEAPELVAVLSYDDMRQGFGLGMQALVQGWTAGLRAVGGGSLQSDPVSFAHLTSDWNPSIGYTVADSRGIFTFTRSPTGGFGSVGGIAGLAIVASIAIPNLAMARMEADQTAALVSLHAIRTAQEGFRASAARDGDGDGEGEYGYLCELQGMPRPGDKRAPSRRSLLNGFVRHETAFKRQGYYYRVYLPADDGSPVGGHENASRVRQVDGDLAESVMVIVAWPVRRRGTGSRAYLLDASGNIFACSAGAYGGSKSPPPDVLSSQPGNLASEPLARAAAPRDGFRWVKVR